jgi:hypothetical protein
MAKSRERIAAPVPPRSDARSAPPHGQEHDVPDAETRAVVAHPEFRALVASAREERERGETTSAEEFFRELGLPLDPPEDDRAPGKNGANQ